MATQRSRGSRRAGARRRVLLVGLAAAAFALTGGCGDDDEGGGGGGGGAKAAAKKPPAKKKPPGGKKQEEISFISTLEVLVPEAERKTIRRRLSDRDFQGSSDGLGNRDPFRSFVLPQFGSTGPLNASTAVSVEPTDACARRKLVASTHSVDNLDLIGIVRRGDTRFALFRDTAGRGHIVQRRDCLGKEKAVVKDIAESLVTLMIVPEQVPGQPERPAVEQSIPLHPNELRVEDQLEADDLAGVVPDTVPASPESPPPASSPAGGN